MNILERRTKNKLESFVVEGKHPLNGVVTVAGNKNAALPMLVATLLSEEVIHLHGVPDIRDVRSMMALLKDVGASVGPLESGSITIQAKSLSKDNPSASLSSSMRASFLLAAPLLARLGHAEVPAAGGDQIGRRPLDTHVHAFRCLGADVEVLRDRYVFTASKGLHGAEIFLHEMSVMATENVVMAACLARGESIICNAASEPHVQDLCNLLVAMGAKIDGIGTNVLRIQGVDRLHSASSVVSPDYVEVGSWIALAAVTRSKITINNVKHQDLRAVTIAYNNLGVRWDTQENSIIVPAEQELVACDGLHGAVLRIHNAPWPGFPADLTSIALMLATQVRGTVMIHDWMYESRLIWVDRLQSMGARVVICDPHRALVIGATALRGQVFSSPDIRAGMALVIAALAADGRSVIHNAQQVDRGYENIDQRLRELGADIKRVDPSRS